MIEVPEGAIYHGTAVHEDESEQRLHQYAARFGDTYASYLATDPGWESLWLRDGGGVVRFARWRRRYVTVVSGLLAPADRREELLDLFLKFVRLNRWHLTFYNIGAESASLFRRRGFQLTKCGEEPIVRLDRTGWQGKPYEWVRRQENFCLRQGVSLREAGAGCGGRLSEELEEVSRQHIAATLYGRELDCFVGRFDPRRLGARRLFVAERDGRIEAFIVCNPCLAGAMWAVEMYRRRPDAPRGVVAFSILRVMRLLQREGVRYCSLSLIPALRCEAAAEGDSPIARTVIVFWWRRLNWIFDFRGIYHFKSRFRPHYRQMYLAAWPRVTPGSMLGLGMHWGLIRFNPLRMYRRLPAWSARLKPRRSLARPSIHSEPAFPGLDPAALSEVASEHRQVQGL